MRSKKKQENMSLVGHLREMRDRLAVSAVVLLAAFAVCFALIRGLADQILEKGSRFGFTYVYLAPSELLTTYFKMSLILAAVMVSPFLVFELWGFVSPALKSKEKKAVLPALFGGFGFFLVGAVFAYFIALPFMIQFLVEFSRSDWVSSSISVASYIDFVIGMIMVFGLVFEMPMLAYALSSLGILTPRLMRKARCYFLPLAFLLAAIITPPDVMSQFMVAIPMIGLYEVSILISAVNSRRRQAEEDEEEDQFIPEHLREDEGEDMKVTVKKETAKPQPCVQPPDVDEDELYYG